MKTYAFKVIVELDEDRWQARCPALQAYGAATWGQTEEEAYKHIHEVVELIVEELKEDGIAIPKALRRMWKSWRTRAWPSQCSSAHRLWSHP